MRRSLALLSLATTMVTLGCTSKETPKPDLAPAVVAPAPKTAATAAEPTIEDAADRLQTVEDFPSALSVAKLAMKDSANEDSVGALVFGLWASNHLAWSDVAVSKDETSFALVQKDPDEARGKRMCTSGKIIQIQVQKTRYGKLNIGLLHSWSYDIYRFIAAGSSGTLVEQNAARICGVVTGKYQYSNSGGGTGHAVELVGMFDLPENKKKKPLVGMTITPL